MPFDFRQLFQPGGAQAAFGQLGQRFGQYQPPTGISRQAIDQAAFGNRVLRQYGQAPQLGRYNAYGAATAAPAYLRGAYAPGTGPINNPVTFTQLMSGGGQQVPLAYGANGPIYAGASPSPNAQPAFGAVRRSGGQRGTRNAPTTGPGPSPGQPPSAPPPSGRGAPPPSPTPRPGTRPGASPTAGTPSGTPPATSPAPAGNGVIAQTNLNTTPIIQALRGGYSLPAAQGLASLSLPELGIGAFPGPAQGANVYMGSGPIDQQNLLDLWGLGGIPTAVSQFLANFYTPGNLQAPRPNFSFI